MHMILTAQLIAGSGPYHRIDYAIRSIIHPSTNQFAKLGHPFVIHYRGGKNATTMQITIVTKESLYNLLHLGRERLVSDSRVSCLFSKHMNYIILKTYLH